VDEWLRCQTLNYGDPKLSPSLTTTGLVPGFNSLTVLVHSQLVCLLQVGILNLFSSFVAFCCYLLSWSMSVDGYQILTDSLQSFIILIGINEITST